MADNNKKQDKKPAKGPDKKANRRGAARLAAVQALYQMDIAGAGINDIFAEFESHWLGGEVEGDKYLPAEAAFFRDVVSGVVRDQAKLDPLIDDALSKGWPLKHGRRRYVPDTGMCRSRNNFQNSSTSSLAKKENQPRANALSRFFDKSRNKQPEMHYNTSSFLSAGNQYISSPHHSLLTPLRFSVSAENSKNK